MTRRLLPVVGLGTVFVALAVATGKLGTVVDRLPITPTPNGFTVFCLGVLACGCWWQLRRAAGPPHEHRLDRLVNLEHLLPGEDWPVSSDKWPADIGEVGPASDGSFCKGEQVTFDPADPTRRVYLSPLRPRAARRVRS